MKIIYTPNPLNSRIELDETDLKILRLKIQIEELEEAIGSAHLQLDPQHREWLNKIRPMTPEEHEAEAFKYLDYPTDERLDKMLGYFVEALLGSHDGDCICECCSCLKCRAEDYIGINTIRGLGKHAGHTIRSAFHNDRTIEQALELLGSTKIREKTEVWKDYSDEQWLILNKSWDVDKKFAYEWLLKYKAEKLCL